MKTTSLASRSVIGARRAVAGELRALARDVAEAAWPPWTDQGLEAAIARLRHTIDEQLDRHEDEVPVIAARLGLDFEVLRATAADPERVRRWVTILAGSAPGQADADVVAELLMVDLFADELAYIGLLARAIGPAERAAAGS